MSVNLPICPALESATPSHPTLRRRPLQAFVQALVIGLTLLLAACRAPGMKFDTRAYDRDTRTQVNGQDVTLHPLNPETLKRYGTRPAQVGFEDLLATKMEPYRIGAQDILMVTVWDHPELTLPLGQFRTDAATGMVVDDAGFLFYPYIGRVKVAGLTVVEARDLITAKMDDVLQKPQVDLKVLAYRSQKVFVSGEVRSPAVYNITDIPFTLAEAVNRAGGFLPTADQSRIMVSRGDRTWSLNFLELMTRGNRIGQILLKDGDSVHVHNRDEEPVYLLGEVRNPRSVPTYHGKLSLAQALSDAGGINPASAEARSIYVFRRGQADNAVEVFHLDAYNPVAMVLADRFALQPRDLVYVDAGPLVRWNRVVSLIVPTVSALTSTASEVKYLSQ
jgi:polysaccharide export outer membrane protein